MSALMSYVLNGGLPGRLKAVEMLLRHIGLQKKAEKLSLAMSECLETEKRLVVIGRRDGASCAEFTDYVIEKLHSLQNMV